MTVINCADDDSPIEYERFLTRSEPLTDTLHSHSSLIIDHQERERNMQITRKINGVNNPGPTVADLRQLIDGVNDDVVVSLTASHNNEGPYSSRTWSITLTEESNA